MCITPDNVKPATPVLREQTVAHDFALSVFELSVTSNCYGWSGGHARELTNAHLMQPSWARPGQQCLASKCSSLQAVNLPELLVPLSELLSVKGEPSSR